MVWYLYPQDVLTIARLFTDGKYDVSRIVALTGPQVEKPRYYRTIAGASIKNMLDENTIVGENNRFISGNVLTGDQIEQDGYLGFYDSQITILEEGNQQAFLGWLSPNLDKFSMSKSYFLGCFPLENMLSTPIITVKKGLMLSLVNTKRYYLWIFILCN